MNKKYYPIILVIDKYRIINRRIIVLIASLFLFGLSLKPVDAAQCGNGICEVGQGETALSCPGDCESRFIGADNTDNPFVYDYLQPFVDNQIKFFGREKVSWNEIESSPTSGYNWSNHDSSVQKNEAVGGIVISTIWSISTWATEHPSSGEPSSPPKPEYRQRYYDFIKTFIERYDHDGLSDMPGLQSAHLYLQIEDEIRELGGAWIPSSACEIYNQQNDAEGYYRCAAQEYGEMLKLAYQAAKEANPNTKVISLAFNPGDYFDNNPSGGLPLSDPDVAKRVYFLEEVFSNYNQYFDIIGIQCNYDYTGIPAWINYIKTTWGYLNKPIICSDAGSMPMLSRHQFHPEDKYLNKYPYLTDQQILAILDEGISHPQFTEIKTWWEGEKAKLSVKKAVVAAGAGADNIFFQFIIMGQAAELAWRHSGLLSRGYAYQNDGPLGTPRAVVYALGQLNEKITNLRNIENLNPIPLGVDPYSWRWLYRFNNGSNTIYIIWNDAGETANLSSYISTPSVKITPLVTTLDSNYNPIYPSTEIVSTSSIQLSRAPIFIEKSLDTISPVISSVASSAITTNSATINWTTDESSDSQVEYGLTISYGYQTTLNTSLVTSHSINLIALLANTTYHYRVKSKDAAGNLTTSNDYTFTTITTTDNNSPTVPANLTATPISSIQINLTWTASTDNVGVTGYRIYRGGTQIAISPTNSYQNTGLSPSTLYTYTVAAYDAGGNVSPQSQAVSATTLGATDTTPPIISSASTLSITSNSATITWTTNENSDSQVEYGLTTSYGNFTTTNSSMVTSHSQNLSGLSTATLYHYRVKSKDQTGNLATSADYTFTTKASVGSDTTPPTVPTNLSATAISSSQINLSWTASTDNVGVTGYRIYRGVTQVGTAITTSYSDKGLAANTIYNYKISSYDAAGNASVQSVLVSTATTQTTSSTTPATYPNGTILKTTTSPNLYVVKDSKRELIPNWQSFLSFGYQLANLKIISQEEMAEYEAVDLTKIDSDKDGLTNAQERQYGTDAAKADTDGDGYSDYLEISKGYSPLIPAATKSNPVFAYGKPRLGSLAQEQEQARVLRGELEKRYTKEQLQGLSAKNWHTVVNSYIYGGYPLEAIVKALKYAGKTVHPTICWSAWNKSSDYLNYIEK